MSQHYHNVLVIGGGHLGTYLRIRWNLQDRFYWTREMADLDVAALQKLRPRAVVNTAGKTDLSWCEENPLECFRCNVSAPLHVYRVVRQACGESLPYIHLSSGCIWDGPYRSDGQPFQAGDPPTPACFYAWTKACCDALLMTEESGPLLILRPRQVFSASPSPRNTLTKLLAYPRLLKTPNTMTSVETIARTIELALSDVDGPLWGRMTNVYDRGVTSPFEVGQLLHEAGLREAPQEISKEELDGWLQPRRVDVVMEDELFESVLDPPTVQEQIAAAISRLAGAEAAPV